jgi:glycosyltransferase involved in cell wall biosynthesis
MKFTNSLRENYYILVDSVRLKSGAKMSNLDILFVTTMKNYPWGGSEELWSQTAVELAGRGYKLTTLQPSISEGHPKSQELCRRVYRSEYFKPLKKYSLEWFQRRVLKKKEQQAVLKGPLPKHGVVSQGNNTEGLDWMKRFKSLEIPYTVIVQCNAEWWFPLDAIRSQLKEHYKSAETVVCVSEQNLEMLRLQLAEPLPNAVVIPNPFCLGDHPPPDYPGNSSGELRFACVARIEPFPKGLDVLLRVFALNKWRSRSITLTLYGDGPFRKGIEDMVEFLGLDNVNFAGQVTSYKEIWEKEHALLLPSRYEGMSLALLECMWCARPVLATKVGGAEEIIDDGLNGFLSDSCSITGIDESMERLWDSRDSLKTMGLRARKKIEESIPESPPVLLANIIQDAVNT